MTATPACLWLTKPDAVAKSWVSALVKPLFSSAVEFPSKIEVLTSSGSLLTNPVNF